jgi:hypothetical protein
MMPSTVIHDLMRANERETIRATRYAHHRTHTHRRPGPYLAARLGAWTSKIPVPRRRKTGPMNPAADARDSLRLVVADLGSIDIDAAPEAPVRSGRIA